MRPTRTSRSTGCDPEGATVVVFGGTSYLALTQRDHADVSALPPAVGLLGTATFLPLMLWHRFSSQRGVFYTVAAISVVAVVVELAYCRYDGVGQPPATSADD